MAFSRRQKARMEVVTCWRNKCSPLVQIVTHCLRMKERIEMVKVRMYSTVDICQCFELCLASLDVGRKHTGYQGLPSIDSRII